MIGRCSTRIMADALTNRLPPGPVVKAAEATVARFPREDASYLMIRELDITEAKKKMAYCSTPITGGQRLYDFLAACGKGSKAELDPQEQARYADEVIRPNCDHAHQVAEGLRGQGLRVVEPSRIGVPGWTQTSYNQNWTEFLNELPLSQVTACDGWQLSYGCLLELRTAMDRGIPVQDEQGRPLSRTEAGRQVQQAVDEAAGRGFRLGELPKVLTAPLDQLPMEL